MSFTLFLDKETPALATGRRVIKAGQWAEFQEASGLLEKARRINAAARTENEDAHEKARLDGYQAGQEQAEEQISAYLSELGDQFHALAEERKDDVARAAFAAVQAIIGTIADEAALRGLAEASLARIDGDGPVVIEVAPGMAEGLAKQLKGRDQVEVKANEAFGSLDCQLITPNGRIVADLKLQMEALAQRWGVEA